MTTLCLCDLAPRTRSEPPFGTGKPSSLPPATAPLACPGRFPAEQTVQPDSHSWWLPSRRSQP